MPLSLSASLRTGSAWAVAAAVGLLFAVGLAAAPTATADSCGNAAVRAQSNSTALPDCRAYEMVSSPYKEGFAFESNRFRFTEDGTVSYQSIGSFADNPQGLFGNRYHAARSPAGWITTSLAPPDLLYNVGGNTVQAESADLRWSLWLMRRRDVSEDKLGYYLRGPDGAFTRIGDGETSVGSAPALTGASDDLSHVVFNYQLGGSGVVTALREYVGTGNDGPPRDVSVDNQGQPTPAETCPNATGNDGRVVVYTAGCHVATTQLWARVGGTTTIAVSGSECTRSSADVGGVCNGVSSAAFAGAAADGSRVFFTTRQQLVNGDTNTGDGSDPANPFAGNDLYACDIPAGVPAPVGSANSCASLTQVSGSAGNAQVENAVAVSEDGSRVYFVAQGVLAGNLGLGDVGPKAGSPNLYMWDRDGAHPVGQTRFVTRLAANDLGLDAAALGVTMTPDGRYLLFSTTSSLVTEGPGADTDGARDVYRYDANVNSVVRVSTSVLGDGGNGSGFDVSRFSMTPDGSTVIFDSAEPLSVSDTNGATDVYSWHDGHVSLISAGGGSALGVSPSGRDIFFSTDVPVLGADRDVVKDVYDARVGGGFAPAPAPSCAGDECQGQRSQPPSLAGPSLVGPGMGGIGALEVSSAVSLRAVSAAQRRAAARTGVLSVVVRSSSAGRLTAIASAKFKGKNRRVAMASPIAKDAGTVKIRLKLSSAARKWLRSGRPLHVELSITKKGAKKRSSSVRLPGVSS